MPPIRASLAIIVTVVGLIFLFNFKTPDVADRLTVSPPSLSRTVPGSSSPAPTAAGPSAPAATPTPTPVPSGWRDGTFTGQDVPNQFGDVQVAVVISGGRITDVQEILMPNDRPRSAYISQQAGPMLHDEVLQAQSAQIDLIGGATFTAESYAESVQSALDQAHA